jgi:fatty-acyl-CoA synthase
MAVTVLDADGAITRSWDSVDEMAVRTGVRLTANGLSPGARLAVIGDTGMSNVVLARTAQLAGFEVSFLGPTDVPAGVTAGAESRFRRLCPDAVIGPAAGLHDFVPSAAAHRVAIEDLTIGATSGPAGLARAGRDFEPERFRLLQFTSGTTADPQPITISREALDANLDAIRIRLALSAQDSIFSWLPLNHDLGLVGSVLLASRLRCELTICPPRLFMRHPSRWPEWLTAASPTYLPAPNSGWALLSARAGPAERSTMRTALCSLRSAVTGGEPVDAELCRRLVEGVDALLPDGSVVPAYGLAEATLAVSVTEPGSDFATAPMPDGRDPVDTAGSPVISVGTPLAGTSVTITGPDGPVRDGELGEIVVHGRSLAAEYADLPGGLRTGDEGFVANSQLFVTGRCKDLIKLYGRRVYPHEIERAAESSGIVHPGRSIAFSVPGRPTERVVLLIEPARGGCPQEGEGVDIVRERVLRDLGVRLDVVGFVERGAIPKTTSGKLQRRLARERWLAAR